MARARIRIRPVPRTSSAGCATTTESMSARARTSSRNGVPLRQAVDPLVGGVLRLHQPLCPAQLFVVELDGAGAELALEVRAQVTLHLVARQRREPRERRHRLLRAADAFLRDPLAADPDEPRHQVDVHRVRDGRVMQDKAPPPRLRRAADLAPGRDDLVDLAISTSHAYPFESPA